MRKRKLYRSHMLRLKYITLPEVNKAFESLIWIITVNILSHDSIAVIKAIAILCGCFMCL